jgi:glycosyltransferase involved in cell wall biosynthesis
VLVDGHSTDDMVAVAGQLLPGIQVMAQLGRGKGDALRVGFAAAKGDIIVMIDVDGSADGAEIPRFVAALQAGARYTDLCYGYNAFWARHLPTLNLDCDGFEVEPVMSIRAVRAGLLAHEVPSHEHTRVHRVSNLHIVKDSWRIGKVIVRERLFRQASPGNVSAGSQPKPLASVAQPLLGCYDVR